MQPGMTSICASHISFPTDAAPQYNVSEGASSQCIASVVPSHRDYIRLGPDSRRHPTRAPYVPERPTDPCL